MYQVIRKDNNYLIGSTKAKAEAMRLIDAFVKESRENPDFENEKKSNFLIKKS